MSSMVVEKSWWTWMLAVESVVMMEAVVACSAVVRGGGSNGC
jgi:hypothetical protein